MYNTTRRYGCVCRKGQITKRVLPIGEIDKHLKGSNPPHICRKIQMQMFVCTNEKNGFNGWEFQGLSRWDQCGFEETGSSKVSLVVCYINRGWMLICFLVKQLHSTILNVSIVRSWAVHIWWTWLVDLRQWILSVRKFVSFRFWIPQNVDMQICSDNRISVG